jgi:hypothetical protein
MSRLGMSIGHLLTFPTLAMRLLVARYMVRRIFSSGSHRQANRPDQPSFDELVETVAEMLERMLTPAEGANLAAGKAILRQGLDQAQARFTEAVAPQKKENT